MQLNPSFGLDAAASALPYLARLGITDCYTSPYFTASENSASGYDVCDHQSIQPELGGREAFERFAEELQRAGLGHVIDVVPNHMGNDEARNRWWRDVLALGPRSKYAGYFDIDWRPVKPELRDKLLLPILDKPYGDALDAGDVRLAREGDALVVRYGPRTLPVDPATPTMADPEALTADDIHAVLEQQSYRLAYWRTASDEINYRRFFDVDNLVGLRMEREDVFDEAHRFLARLMERGLVTGIRVDHPDGLACPAEYSSRLQTLAAHTTGRRTYVVVEKILVDDEQVRNDWAVDGTTGYEFLSALNGIFIEPRGAVALRRLYSRLTKTAHSFDADAYAAKKLIMTTTLASEVEMLASALNRLSEHDRRSRDFTLNSLRRALIEFIASLPIYRTYVTATKADPADISVIHAASARARRRNPHLEPSVFQFIESVILGGSARVDRDSHGAVDYPPVDDADAADRARFTERLQQFTGSVFAKGVEDTAFYRHIPLLSANEVGGSPGDPARAPKAFHRENRWRVEHRACGLLTTATHDTKLGEDTRARLNALSEMPAAWSQQIRRWRLLARRWRREGAGAWMPDANDEYRFYQVLVGTWPIDARGEPVTCLDPAYIARVQAYMLKAAREAKQQTSWINPNAEYETALERFVARAIAGPAGERFRGAGAEFAGRLARVGVVNSLAQLVLKLGSPGVADVYQGCETWDLTLVDPDNRRPLDVAGRIRALDAVEPLLERVASCDATAAPDVRALLESWPSGAIKLLLTAAGLRARRRHADLFVSGDYQDVDVVGDGGRLVAFVREHDGRGALVVAPALVNTRMRGDRQWPIGADAWSGVRVQMPANWAGAKVASVLTGEECIVSASGELDVAGLLASVPVGLWLRDG